MNSVACYIILLVFCLTACIAMIANWETKLQNERRIEELRFKINEFEEGK